MAVGATLVFLGDWGRAGAESVGREMDLDGRKVRTNLQAKNKIRGELMMLAR
jgi:hypothetical protein